MSHQNSLCYDVLFSILEKYCHPKLKWMGSNAAHKARLLAEGEPFLTLKKLLFTLKVEKHQPRRQIISLIMGFLVWKKNPSKNWPTGMLRAYFVVLY